MSHLPPRQPVWRFPLFLFFLIIVMMAASNRKERECERSGGVWHDKQCWTKIE